MATSPGVDMDAAAAAAARCDLNGNATTTATTTSKTRKEKTILGWLVKSASANDKNSDSNSINDNDNDNSNSCNCETRAFRDFRGVQTLRLLWSKRINNVSEQSAAAANQRANQPPSGLGTLRKLNKSVSCLVNAFNNARDWPSPTNAHETRSRRAASLHNLQETAVRSGGVQQLQQVQRDKDNFNAFKNAEQARMQSKLRRSSEATFPAVKAGGAAGERLQWPKREDVMAKCKTERAERQASLSETDKAHENEIENEHKQKQAGAVVISAAHEQPAAMRVSLSATSAQSGSNESLQTLNSIKSDATANTSESSAISTVTSQAPQQRSGVTRRKYSFKTHAGKAFHQHHTPRRMSSQSHSASGSSSSSSSLGVPPENSSSSGSGSGSSSGLVRELTEQFNEIIQKDARLLKQVKRNNGVWLARGAHVYKIVEKPSVQQQQQQQEEQLNSTVQHNIKKFERLEKPAVPRKTQQLLRIHQELMNNAQRPSTLSRSKEWTLKLAKLQQLQQQKAENHHQLEMVQEEPKTPVEASGTDEADQSAVDADAALKPNTEPQAANVESAPQQQPQQLTQPTADDNGIEDGDELAARERQKRSRHKYATIYEKLRFLPFPKSSKKSANVTPLKTQRAEPKPKPEPEPEPELEPLLSPCVEADAMILDALDVLDQKLKILTRPAEMGAEGAAELLLAPDDDFEQRVLPNNSFIYQASNKQISNNQLLLNQAVNVSLVNTLEGEQMIMEQKLLAAAAASAKAEAELEPMYEPITPTSETKTEPQANQTEEPTEDIYQTVEEATSSNNWLEDYESIAGTCEAANKNSHSSNDDYEAFATPPAAEEAVAPTTNNSTGTLGRNTRDQLPELPKPQRVLPKSPTILRPAPPKPSHPSRLASRSLCKAGSTDEDDENIYDTIKGCYESMSTRQSRISSVPSIDGISLSSNCYESISNYRKSKPTTTETATSTTTTTAAAAAVTATTTATGVQLSSSGSTLTISSDHRTNSLYESSLAAGVLYGNASVGCRSSLTSSAGSSSRSRSKKGDKRSSLAGSSDNSDAWVDISDSEVTAATASTAAAAATATPAASEAQFIVVRERFKQHRVRSPDWSKRIRDKRLQQNKAKSYTEDDSDHYYETLSPLGSKRHATLPNQHHKRNQDLPRSSQHSASAHALGQHVPNSDDYDSFETDSDEQTEQEQRLHHHNDSGVDMRNHRLPEPPAPQNQVYAIVRKFKDFISNKKSPKGSQQKIYENATQTNSGSQFYVDCGKQEIYAVAQTLSSSEKNLLSQQEKPVADATACPLRPKQKNGKSLRSRIRKSLVGGSFDAKTLSTLTPTRSTFYIEDPPVQQQQQEQQQEQELDSGFSEKASSGDIPVPPPTPAGESQKFLTITRKIKKEAKNMRRRSSGMRPHEPPPPPPPLPPPPPEQRNGCSRANLEPDQTTSWYTECGVFKQSATTLQVNGEPVTPILSTNGGVSSWYAESGLYQTSGISVASSSGSSGVSTGNEACPGDDLQPHSLFDNEPLYQVYSAAKLESITRDLEAQENSTDAYEEIGQLASAKTIPTAMRPSALQLVEPKNGPSRTLWSEVPEVIHSCILPTLTPRERGLQEAKFEIMTSEASYLKSLNLLRSHFMNNAAFWDGAVLSTRDRKALFSHIVPVRECSERLLTELECCWQNNIMLLGLSRRIYEIAERQFHVYVTFCEHQGRMDRTLRRLKQAKNGAFQQQLEKLEASPSCCGLSLLSFLMLPMQRITRLPLLIDAVFSKESPNNAEEYESWKMTLALVQKIVAQCNEAANRWEQANELERISKQLEFPSYIRALAIAPVGVPKQGAKPRYLVRRGELTHLVWRGEDAKLTFGKRFTKTSIYAFLFSDLLVLCKRKGASSFTVFDYCPRSMLTIASGDSLQQLPTKDLKDSTSKNLMLMTLLENYERKTVELVLSCPTVSDQQRWLEAMRPPEAETPGEKLYDSWDCPQVIAKHSYESDEPDVLQLELGDVVNISRKLPDGWYQGERIRDGAVGWFPGSYTEELNSAHVRSRNLKQRHRLLTFTATYLEAQKAK